MQKAELRPLARAATALTLASSLASCSGPSGPGGAGPATARAADTIYLNGAVYTVAEARPWAEALAVADGRLVAVGANADVLALKADRTTIVDLQGRLVMPGIHDQHTHPVQAGLAHLFECSFPFSLTLDQIVAKVRACAEAAPKGTWIRGGQWAKELLTSRTVPTRQVLDGITRDHPVLLIDSTFHDAWLNSRALELLGITRSTSDPGGGVIDRDSRGEPTGILHDNATFQATQRLPAYEPAQYAVAVTWAMGQLNAAGVTSMRDALVDSHGLTAYSELDRAGKLTMRVGTSLAWKASWSEPREREEQNIRERGQYRTAGVNTDFIKIFLDGIPPTRTAAMLEPYLPDEQHGAAFTGALIHEPADFTKDVVALDAQGLTVKVHATGDRGARVALDAFEAARKANGASDRRHEVSHAELIHPSDLPRFKALNVTAEMCPILWYPSPLVEMMAGTLGAKRAHEFWPTRALVDSGALVIYGSDWPSVVPDPSPWPGLESLVTRRNPYTNDGEPLWAEQAVDLATAVRIFTLNGAVAARQAADTGSLEAGKSADFIVLDRNIFTVPIEQVSDAKVLSVVIRGSEVSPGR
jgi:predicted amidohydrolase YtcJ